jgi:hypothetical protein
LALSVIAPPLFPYFVPRGCRARSHTVHCLQPDSWHASLQALIQTQMTSFPANELSSDTAERHGKIFLNMNHGPTTRYQKKNHRSNKLMYVQDLSDHQSDSDTTIMDQDGYTILNLTRRHCLQHTRPPSQYRKVLPLLDYKTSPQTGYAQPSLPVWTYFGP